MNPFVRALQEGAPRDALALRWDGASISFGALAERARGAAGWLARQGVGPGDRVAALLPSGPAFVELLHAAMCAGAVLVPLNTRLTARELAAQLLDSEPALLVHGAGALAARAAEAGRALRRVEVGVALPPGDASHATAPSDADPLVALVYTSGTTGRAKGVMLGAGAFAASAAASRAQLGVRAGDRWLACLPPFHVGGLAILLRSVLEGVAVELHAGFDADRVAARIAAGEIEWISLVPTMLARVLRSERFAASPALRGILLGGAAAPAPLLEEARARGLPLAPTYGLTEAASQVATRPPGVPGGGLAILPGTSVRIACDGDGGDTGEIHVAGPTLMRGYWRQPAESERTLRDGWLRTGDLGRLDAFGALHVLSRRSDLIVSGGENVYPAEVEAVLLAHPQVRDAAVAGVPDPEFGARPAAWIVSDAPLDAESLRAFCRARLAGYKVPVAFARLPELPRNAGGKLLRDRLS